VQFLSGVIVDTPGVANIVDLSDPLTTTPFQDYFTKLTPLSIIDVPCERGTHKYKIHVHVKISRGSRRGRGAVFR
jgi:hypothetical protein